MKARVCVLAVLLAVSIVLPAAAALESFITMTNGYFYDPAAGKAWIPHGIAYQTWNRPLGVWQSHEQIDYDLDEMVKMGANSIRVDFVWQHIEEQGDNAWDWANYDYLVQAAEQRGIRIFALIGYQWPPGWFPDDWYTMHPPEYDSEGIVHTNRWPSDIINYEHPEARAQYAEFFTAVCSRYKDSKAIVGWIVGNEYGYLGLWSGLPDGYDPESEQAFRDWTAQKYGSIANANAAWGTQYGAFSNIVFVEQYRAYGVEGAQWADMVQWREDSIADYTALGARAAKLADTNHLISYSTVGMQWGEEDWRYHAEDRGKITAACAATNARLDFFSVNNYPWSVLGHESQNGQWGISFTKKVAGIPVLYTETGFSSSESMWPGMNEARQGPLVRNSLWESLEAGAIGTHIFAWHDRPYITDREKGFGILYANRVIKPAYWVSRNTYNLMDQLEIRDLLKGSQDPKPDVAFLWTDANDSQYNRYECEMQQIAGALERLGYEPNFMSLQDLASGAYTNYRLVILPRNLRVETAVPGYTNSVLNFLLKRVIPAGVHVLATADLPGMQDFHGKPRAAFQGEVDQLFGIDASDPGGFEMPQRRRHYTSWYWKLIEVDFTTNAIGAVAGGYHYWPYVWKYSEDIALTGGRLWATMNTDRNRGFEDSKTHPAKWDGWWGQADGNLYVTNWAGFAFDGTNFVGMWGNAGMWQDFPVVPFGRYTASTYLRSNSGDPLHDGSYAGIGIEWYDEKGYYLGISESPRLTGATPADGWVRYKADAYAPSNAWTARRIIRVGANNLLANGALTGSGSAPTGWSQWGDGSHDPEPSIRLGTAGNSWAFWWDGGIWQDVSAGIGAGDTVEFGGFLSTPAGDRLRGGTKHGTIQLEFYSNATPLGTVSASPAVSSNSAFDVWTEAKGSATVPAGANVARLVVRCNDAASGDGRFLADDVYLRNPSRGGGSVFVDHSTRSPAVVVKDHGPAKSAIFLYSAGDMRPDGDLDSNPDTYNWKWRYDVFGAVVRDYFGIAPPLTLAGTNACYALADYRTCPDGSTLWQIKNYLYDTNYPNGGAPQTFTIQSPLLAGRTVRAFDQARILATNSGGTVSITLDPDGMDMLHVYPPRSNDVICQIADAPAMIHPFADKNYQLTLKYDTLGKTNCLLFVQLMVKANPDIGTTNAVLQTIQVAVSGAGTTNLWMWMPEFNFADSNYVSSADGGEFAFVVGLTDASSNLLAEVQEQATELKWGVRPTSPPPSTVENGSVVNLPVEWQDLYEHLPWQNTPMPRNDAFPARVAVFRSLKTEAQYPGHLGRVNQVCDWLETLGYLPGNDLELAFDNVIVSLNTSDTNAGPQVVFSDAMETGTNGWTADGLWHLDRSLSASPSNSWLYNNGANYNTGARNTGSLVTPWIDLSNAALATLSFKSWYETEDTGTSWDKKLVYVSRDGTTWAQVLQISGPNRQWVSQSVDLSAWAGGRVKVKFVFDTVDAIYNQFRGWAVDDVTVVADAGGTVDLFFDDMETATNWTGDGLWRWATNRAASPTHSFVYNNGTNYQTGARNSGSLVSRWIDLSDAASATLTFKSWYRTEDTGTSWDRKTLLVSADGTNWAQVLQVSGAAQEWTTQTLDLSAYAGRAIRLKFLFDTIDAINNGFEGWYVDDVRITTIAGAGVAVFSDNVESGTNGWAAAGLWHEASDLSASPTRAWAYNNGSNYNTGARNSAALVSPWIDLTPAASAKLTFKSWYETEDTGTTWDRKLVHVTTDGTNWVQVAQVSGLNRQWVTMTCDLSAFAGSRVRVRFLFDTIDAVYNQFRGWYVDNVAVTMVGSDLLFADSFAGGLGAWTRAAGAANWEAADGTARAGRIGNDDNILHAGSTAWSNYTLSADIRYNRQGPYFNDAELYLRYRDRNNFVKVGIRNANGFWRLKYTVRDRTNLVGQGWIHEFSKTNSPAEGAWYNLKVRAEGSEYTVCFDGEEVGAFTATNFPSGAVAIGTRAAQLGNWEPVRGYFFIDDDEYSWWTPVEGATAAAGSPLNLDWGYLNTFYPILVLPSTYVMSDIEVSNVCTWIRKGMFSLLATDGGVAMKNETGAYDPGRIEALFGVQPSLGSLADLDRVTIRTNLHYATMDYAAGAERPASGAAVAWTAMEKGVALGTADNGAYAAPALVANVLTNDPWSPKKVFCFNFGADTGGQLTGSFSNVARRAFEWLNGQAHRVRVMLKYQVHPDQPSWDPTVAQWETWALGGTGSNSLAMYLPADGIMTGTNLYWIVYTYPWDAADSWSTHDGFYSSANDGAGLFTTIGGLGLQIFGGADRVFGGRTWDIWMGYNTLGQPMKLEYGLKEKGPLQNEDNFDDGNANGWTVQPVPNYRWGVTNGALRYTAPSEGGVSWLMRDGLDVADKNVTIEYDVKYSDINVEGGGLIYRGHILYLNPWDIRWATNSPLDLSSGTASNFSGLVTNADGSVSYVITGTVTVHIGPPYFTTGAWHHVVVNIRDGDPYPVSDVYVDGQVVLLMEPLRHTNWTSSSVGFLGPARYGYVEWDDVRVADEQYSFVTQAVSGVYVPTNNVTPFYPYVPDYDPDMWEYEGTGLGGQYEWFAYLRGKNTHAGFNVALYFAPRLMVEDPLFPTQINAGQTVQVPVEWEQLPQVPMKLHLELMDPYAGATAFAQEYMLTSAAGAAYFAAGIPSNALSSANYLWAAYIYPTSSVTPAADKIGLDDTFRFNTLGQPVEPETAITLTGGGTTEEQISLYSDAGLLPGCDVYTWYGSIGAFNGDYTNVVPPEGVKSFYTYGNYWQGWGIFSLDLGVPEPKDMTAYTNGFLVFWVKSTATLKVDLEDTYGTKRAKYVGSTSNVWKEITIPISDFGGVKLTHLYGLFEITQQTAGTFLVDHVRWVKGVFHVYRDTGIPAGAGVMTWDGGGASYNGQYIDMSAPEGASTFQTVSANYAGWGVMMTNGTADMRTYSNGYLRFWVKSTNALKVEIEGPQGTKGTPKYISSSGGVWQELEIPVYQFGAVNLAQVFGLFEVTAEAGTTFYIDGVRWERGTATLPSQPAQVVYSDAGIPPASDVFVWWASQYWDHCSATINDGGFEESTANGTFPDSGFWAFAAAGGSATAQCSTLAAAAGAAGLRAKTGNESGAWWSSTYQEITAYAGDIYRASAYARQPSDGGGTWVAGSEAYLRLSFLDASHAAVTSVVSAAKVTADNQGWTLCEIGDTTAPGATRYVRLELVVQKPNGSAGISVADFDDARLRQANSFNGQFAEDPNTPEGAQCFRSYCVNWSGWGIFYTNSTADFSAYSNGYLKFWLKSSGYSQVQIQSAGPGATNTATGAFYGPTTNALGESVWQAKSIAITNFGGVSLTNIKSPFMLTDPTFDRAYSVDYVRWELTP